MTEFAELTALFSIGFEDYIIGGKMMVGLFAILILLYICFRCRLGVDTVTSIMIPMICLLSVSGYLPFILLYLTLMVAGAWAGLTIYKIVS